MLTKKCWSPSFCLFGLKSVETYLDSGVKISHQILMITATHFVAVTCLMIIYLGRNLLDDLLSGVHSRKFFVFHHVGFRNSF